MTGPTNLDITRLEARIDGDLAVPRRAAPTETVGSGKVPPMISTSPLVDVTPEQPNTEQPNTERRAPTSLVVRLQRFRSVVLAAVVALPPALNAQNIVAWAASPDGLGLNLFWSWVVFGGLDLIAVVCVLETIIQSQNGKKAGAFAALVWLFAAASAYAGFRHGTQPGVGRDVKWFFPFMALAGPVLLHLILTRSRKDVQVADGKRLEHAPASAYGIGRWFPCVGAFWETYCSWRIGRLEGITKPAVAVERYRALRPDAGRSGLRVLRAMRMDAERRRTAIVAARSAERAAKAAANSVAAVRANTPAPEHPNTARPNTRTPNTVTPFVRPPAPAVRSDTTTPSGDVEANMAKLRSEFGDWRTNTPTVRAIAAVLSVSVSTGQAYRNRLIAEQPTAKPTNGHRFEGASA